MNPLKCDAPIGVFDSGVGGLSVLREIRNILPAENLLYVADSGYAPYGDRTIDFIQQRSESIADFFAAAGVKAVVVACNTATAVAVKGLRSRFSMPIIAIEPAIKPAVAITRSGVIGILATTQTIASANFSQLIEKHGQGRQILLQPCPNLVEQIEQAKFDDPETKALIIRYLSPLLKKGADTLVPGCTHFPFVSSLIGAIAGSGVSLVDPAIPVAIQLRRRLTANKLIAERALGMEQFWTSGAPHRVQPVVRQLWNKKVEVKVLPSTFLIQ